MTKKELAINIANKCDISQANATAMIDMVMDSIRETLEEGEEVILRGFGSFKPVVSASRSGRNLRTQERVTIPAKVRIRFKNYMEEKEVI
jgi:nucleoid DNA-binding protein